MNIKKRVCIIICFCFNLIFFAEVTKSQQTVQTKYSVIRLLSDEIIPSTATINLGTVIIWVNEDREMVEIQFTNTKNMAISCDGSTRFNTDSEWIISEKIPLAGLKSICLIQKGVFNYIVKRESHKLKGKIIVK